RPVRPPRLPRKKRRKPRSSRAAWEVGVPCSVWAARRPPRRSPATKVPQRNPSRVQGPREKRCREPCWVLGQEKRGIGSCSHLFSCPRLFSSHGFPTPDPGFESHPRLESGIWNLESGIWVVSQV